MQEILYEKKPHTEIANSLKRLGLANKAIGNYEQAIKHCSKALGMISNFPNNYFIKTIQNALNEIAIAFASNYSLDPQIITNKICSYSIQGLDFTDYRLHYDRALLLQQNNILQSHEIIEEYKLALIFLPAELLETKEIINANLVELTNFDSRGFELWVAVKESNTDKIGELLNEQVNINFINNGTTSLIEAIIHGNEVLISMLLAEGADINLADKQGASPLYYSLGFAGQPINIKIVKLLLQNGADVNQPMFDGDTPIHMAHYKGNKEAIKCLEQSGGNINTKNLEGKTPLHCLLDRENINIEIKLGIIEAFLDKYAMSIQDNAGKTVIEYAKEHCSAALSILLDEEGYTQLVINESLINNDASILDSSILPGNIESSSASSTDST